MSHSAQHPLPRPVLIGLMGCGKSSIGRRLAKQLDMPLIDLDDYIVEQQGVPIPSIFEHGGESRFRDIEAAALRKVITTQAVLATGGGIVLREGNRHLLKAHPPVIWLKATPEFLAGRVAGDSNRPLIAGQYPLQKMAALAAERYILYETCADIIVERDDMNKNEIVALILDFLQRKS